MKRSTKIVLGSLVTLSLVGMVAAKQLDHNGDGPGCSFGSDHDGGSRGNWISKRIAWKLDLNEGQEAEFDELKMSLFKGLDGMRAKRLTSEQVQSVLDTQFDQAKAMQLLSQRLVMIEDNAPALISAFAGFYDSLDAAQQAELGGMIEHRMSHKEQHWGGRDKGEQR